MAKELPKLLTKRRAAHRLLSWLAAMQLLWQGYQDVRAAKKAQQQYGKNRVKRAP